MDGADAEIQDRSREPKLQGSIVVDDLTFKMQGRLSGGAGPADELEETAAEGTH